MILTEEYIHKLYGILKLRARKAYEQGRYDDSLAFLKSACQTAYTFYLGFTDSEIEELLRQIGEKIVKKECTSFSPRCVFYDTFSQDAQGLTMQYVDAIIAAGWEMLYITEFNLDDPRSVRLKQTLAGYAKAKVKTVASNMAGLKKVQFIYDAITEYAPDKLFMHIHPNSVEPVAAFSALPKGITRYQINLTDHTYWVGAGCIDYSFEFRNYGASLSVAHRGLKKEQILMLPYYPMMKETAFEGFPKEAEGKVKIFAGSSHYKIIDKEETFFKLNKAILDANPNAITLFAGGGDMQMLDGYIERNGLTGRFIPIGQRNDIFECYKHCDIYLSSFPLAGALMAQFAAHAGLPILAYSNKRNGIIEEFVCQKHTVYITSFDFDSLVAEASRLVNDVSYRKSRGLAMKDCVVGIDEFNSVFKEIVKTGNSLLPVLIDENVRLHYLNIEDKLKLENKTKGIQLYLFNDLGIKCFSISPSLWLDGFFSRIRSSRLFNKK